MTILRTILKVPIVIVQFLIAVYFAGLHNKYNVITLPFNFFVNFLPIVIWLTIFKKAGEIPITWRPDIHGKTSFMADMFMFGDYWGEILVQYQDRAHGVLLHKLSFVVSTLGFALPFLVCLPLALWYYIYYVKKYTKNLVSYHLPLQNQNPKTQLHIVFIPLMVWMALNVDHQFASQAESNFKDWKNMMSWIFYVLAHLLAPIFTAVYLYVFKAPGTLKCFSLAMGLPNICGVFTHLLLPMAPPWFTHMYGLFNNTELNYNTPGYAAGLIRVNFKAGTHLASEGFHKSPIVFGAVPSLHSAMAFQCFLFIWFNRVQSAPPSALGVSLGNDIEESCTQNNDTTDLEHGVSKGLPVFAEAETQSAQSLQSLQSMQSETPKENFTVEEFDMEDMLLAEDTKSVSSDQHSRTSLSRESFAEDSPVATEDYTPDPALADLRSFNNTSTDLRSFESKSRLVRVIKFGWIPRVIVSLFLLVQWWATMYLDHHYRFDLFVGTCYSMSSFLLINHFVLQKRVLTAFAEKREMMMNPSKENPLDDEGMSMGMRVFRGTKIEWVFDSFQRQPL
ncbi:hypothetical protein ACO0RG_002439 [Hanseniaspora osmophila]